MHLARIYCSLVVSHVLIATMALNENQSSREVNKGEVVVVRVRMVIGGELVIALRPCPLSILANPFSAMSKSIC